MPPSLENRPSLVCPHPLRPTVASSGAVSEVRGLVPSSARTVLPSMSTYQVAELAPPRERGRVHRSCWQRL